MQKILIVSDDRPGVLADISEALARADVNIETLNGRKIGDFCVATLTVDKYDIALKALNETASLQAISEDVLLIRLEDRPGALAQIAKRFSEAQVNVSSIHFIRRSGGYSLVALSLPDDANAVRLVDDVRIA